MDRTSRTRAFRFRLWAVSLGFWGLALLATGVEHDSVQFQIRSLVMVAAGGLTAAAIVIEYVDRHVLPRTIAAARCVDIGVAIGVEQEQARRRTMAIVTPLREANRT